MLPERVAPELFGGSVSPERFPVGYTKSGIEPAYYDFSKLPVMLAVGEDDDLVNAFVEGVCAMLAELGGMPFAVLDPGGLLPGIAGMAEHKEAAGDVAEVLGALLDGSLPAETLVVIPSVCSLLEGCGADEAAGLKKHLEQAGDGGSNPLLVGEATWRLSRHSFEAWYKGMASYGSGIWLGDNITSQTVLRIGTMRPEHRNPVERGFGHLVVKGSPVEVKHVVYDGSKR